MSAELILEGTVRSWVDQVLPGEPGAADAAAAVAILAFSGGASVSEACIEARRLVGSWSRHPSRPVHRPILAAVS
jgi:hypothetical protein